MMRQLFHARRTSALAAALLLSLVFSPGAVHAQQAAAQQPGPQMPGSDDEDDKKTPETAAPAPHDNHVAPNPAVDFPAAQQHVKQCEDLDDSVLRLQCFDRLTQDLGFAQDVKTEQQLAKFGFWTATSKLNGMGERLTNMRLPPNKPYISSAGVVRIPELILSCKVNYTEAYLDWKADLGTNAKGLDVVYNLDNDPPVTVKWDVSNDTFALFIPHGLDFIRSLNGRKTLTVQVTPGGDSLATLVFNLDGLQNVLNLMYERCYK